MKNYLKKLLVGILVAALSVTGIDYVPVMADLAAGDNILADYDSTMADTEQWGYNNAWVSQNSDMGFSTANFADNGGPFYGAVGNEAAIYTKTEFELNPGTYTINFKGYAEGTDAFPYVNGKVDTSYVSLSGSWKNPKAEALTFTVSEKTTAKVGLFFVASTGEGWFNVSDISIVYTSDEVPAEDEFYVGFNGNLTDNTKMTSEGGGKYTYKCGAVTEGNVEFGVYSSTSWNDGVVGWANYTIYSDGYGEIVYTTSDNKVVYNVYSDSNYTDLIENTSVAPDFYFGYPDNLKPMVKVSDNEYTYEYGADRKSVV